MRKKIDVCLIQYRGFGLTYNIMKSIDENTDPEKYDLRFILVDNGSEDPSALIKKDAPRQPFDLDKCVPKDLQARTDVYLFKQNYGAIAMNTAWANSRPDSDIISPNNDVIFTPGWLDEIYATLERHPNAGLISPMVSNSGSLKMVRQYEQPVREDFQLRFLPSICWFIPRKTIKAVGFLDPNYRLGWAEDVDYGEMVRAAGLETWISGRSFVFHCGSGSATSSIIDYGNGRAENEAYFAKKWGRPI